MSAEEMRKMGYDDIAFVMATREGVRTMNAAVDEERLEEYLARRRYDSQSSSSGTIEESSSSHSSSEASEVEVDRTELGDDEVPLKVLADGEDVVGIPLVAQETGGTLFSL